MAVMDNVSRPLIAVLLATVAVFALWLLALKPGGSSSGGSGSKGSSSYQAAIAKARQTVAQSSTTAPAQGVIPGSTGSTAQTSAASTSTAGAQSSATTTATVSGAQSASASHSPAATRQRMDVVSRALSRHKVVALLFYNPAAADDRAVKHELSAIPARRGRVVKLAVPLSEVGRYPVVTTQVPVNLSPTLVLIDARKQAGTIVGFADSFEIAERVDQALAVRSFQLPKMRG